MIKTMCEICKYKNKDIAEEPCVDCSVTKGNFRFDISEHDKQIREEVIDKFNEIDNLPIQENAIKYMMFKEWLKEQNK